LKKKSPETIVFLLDNDTAQADYAAVMRRAYNFQVAQHCRATPITHQPT
jgi:hypothetical protein